MKHGRDYPAVFFVACYNPAHEINDRFICIGCGVYRWGYLAMGRTIRADCADSGRATRCIDWFDVALLIAQKCTPENARCDEFRYGVDSWAGCGAGMVWGNRPKIAVDRVIDRIIVMLTPCACSPYVTIRN